MNAAEPELVLARLDELRTQVAVAAKLNLPVTRRKAAESVAITAADLLIEAGTPEAAATLGTAAAALSAYLIALIDASATAEPGTDTPEIRRLEHQARRAVASLLDHGRGAA